MTKKTESNAKRKKPRQMSRKAPYKKEHFEKFVHQNRQFQKKQELPPPEPPTKKTKIKIFLKLLPYILASMLAMIIKYQNVGAVVAKAAGDAYVRDNSPVKDKNFKHQTKFFINGVIDILSSFDTLELLAFSTSLFAFFAEDVPKIIKNAQNIQGISYADIYASIFAQLLKLRETFGGKLGLKRQKAYPL